MKKSVKLGYCGLALLAAHSMAVNAADISTINVTGNVVASPCVIDASNATVNIDLGSIQAASLATAGTFGDWKTFDVVLKSCPASTTKVNVVFSGTPDTGDATRYKNTGTATNLAVELTSGGGMNFGNTKGTTINVAANTATFALRTRAYATGTVMPGTINATVVASFTYN
jgi:minor fimbrial subunit